MASSEVVLKVQVENLAPIIRALDEAQRLADTAQDEIQVLSAWLRHLQGVLRVSGLSAAAVQEYLTGNEHATLIELADALEVDRVAFCEAVEGEGAGAARLVFPLVEDSA